MFFIILTRQKSGGASFHFNATGLSIEMNAIENDVFDPLNRRKKCGPIWKKNMKKSGYI